MLSFISCFCSLWWRSSCCWMRSPKTAQLCRRKTRRILVWRSRISPATGTRSAQYQEHCKTVLWGIRWQKLTLFFFVIWSILSISINFWIFKWGCFYFSESRCSHSEGHFLLPELQSAVRCDRPSRSGKGPSCLIHQIVPDLLSRFWPKVLFVFSTQSSLLSSILGELPSEKGVVKVKGQLTYAAQQPWVFPGTVRSNILFGKELDPQKYEKVLKACALKRVRLSLIWI